MTENKREGISESPIEFEKTRGSSVAGRYKDKRERIYEAMCDLKLAIDGIGIQLSQSENPDQFQQTSAAFARACSIFLRKMVLGDRDDPKTRLLDDEIAQSLDLRFERLRRISPNRIPLEIIWKLDGGDAQFTKLDDNTFSILLTWNENSKGKKRLLGCACSPKKWNRQSSGCGINQP